MEEPLRKRRNREHTNSRNGCAQCKARKVKCDEEKPKCRACNRRSTACTYSSDGLNQLASAASAASSSHHEKQDHSFSFTPIQSEFGPTPLNDVGRQPPAPPEPAHNIAPVQQEYRNITPRNGGGRTNGAPLRIAHPLAAFSDSRSSQLTLNLCHMELLHHFIAVTSNVLSGGTTSPDIWHMTVPKIALSHDWLMHGILAVSALHIAHLRPEQRNEYWKRATLHQDQALQGQQKALAHPTRDNGDALFAFSLLIIYLAFASLDTSESTEDAPLQSVIRCLHMVRGTLAAGPTIRHLVEVGPLAKLLRFPLGNIKSNPTFREASTEAHFSKLLIFASTHGDVDEDPEMNDTESYAAAASSLRTSFLKVEAISENEAKTPPIWRWAVRLPASFVTRLSEYHVVPLILVAHWCVLLAQVQHYWWIQCWVDQALGEAMRCLPSDYRDWLDWPSEQIREIKDTKAKEGR